MFEVYNEWFKARFFESGLSYIESLVDFDHCVCDKEELTKRVGEASTILRKCIEDIKEVMLTGEVK